MAIARRILFCGLVFLTYCSFLLNAQTPDTAAIRGTVGLAQAMDVLDTSRAVIDDVWPEVKPKEAEKPVGSGMPSVGVPSA